MNSQEQFSSSDYAAEMVMAERELSAFIRAVTQLFGPEEAELSAEEWLDESESYESESYESESMDSPPRSTTRNWRAVTVAASARLANRLGVAKPGSGSPRERRDTPSGLCRSGPSLVAAKQFNIVPAARL